MERLKLIIQHTGLSQKDFAERIGLSGNAITELLKGRSKGLSEKSLTAIAIEFSVNINWLLTGEGEMFLNQQSSASVVNDASVVKERNGFKAIDGNVETYPQVDDIEKVTRSKWWSLLSAVKKFIFAGLDEIQDPEFLSMLKNMINFQVLKERAEKEEAQAVKLKQKGETG